MRECRVDRCQHYHVILILCYFSLLLLSFPAFSDLLTGVVVFRTWILTCCQLELVVLVTLPWLYTYYMCVQFENIYLLIYFVAAILTLSDDSVPVPDCVKMSTHWKILCYTSNDFHTTYVFPIYFHWIVINTVTCNVYAGVPLELTCQ